MCRTALERGTYARHLCFALGHLFVITVNQVHHLRADGSLVASYLVLHPMCVTANRNGVFVVNYNSDVYMRMSMHAFGLQLEPRFHAVVEPCMDVCLSVLADEVFVASGRNLCVYSATDGVSLRSFSWPFPRHLNPHLITMVASENGLLCLLRDWSEGNRGRAIVLSMSPAGEEAAEHAWSNIPEASWPQALIEPVGWPTHSALWPSHFSLQTARAFQRARGV
jgi:hypothetical protein